MNFQKGHHWDALLRSKHLYHMGVVAFLVSIHLATTSAALSTTLERWRNCTKYKDIWPNDARWSNNVRNDGSGGLDERRSKTPLYIAGFLPFSNAYFDQLVCTVLMAVDHVNNEPSLLPDYELRMIWNWTQSQPGPALKYLYDVIYNSPQVLMAWGPTYSRVGEILNRVAAEYNLVQVGIAQFQANDELTEHYPYTVQIYPANSVFNPARIALLKEMGWKRAAIVYQNVKLFREEMEELALMMREQGLNTVAIETVNDDPRSNIESLKRHDARIIFLTVYNVRGEATRFLCEAYRNGLYGPKYVWILMGWYHANWWEYSTNQFLERGENFCSLEQVQTVVEGYLSLRGFEIQEDLSEINFNGIYPDNDRLEFFRHLQEALLTNGACDSYGYDQVMTIALALNASARVIASRYPGLSLNNFTYDNTLLADIILEETKKIQFVGLTGPGAFDDFGNRKSDAVVQQLQDGQVEQVFVYDRKTDTIRWKTDFQWGGSITPVDGPTERAVDIVIDRVNRIVVFTAASLGIILAVVFLAFNITYRHERALKISSPMLNNVIVIGGIFLYSSIFLLTELFHVKNVENTIRVYQQCQSALLFACVGFSMSFGALFVKTYRIHQIYTSAMKVRKVLKGMTDTRLLFAISCFVVADVAFFALWMIYDPMTIQTQTFTPIFDETDPEKEFYLIPTLNTCLSAHTVPFLGALTCYKGGMLLFGVFLAWSTRNIGITEINDSKYIALSVYTVCLTCVITVPCAYVYYSQGSINFAFSFVGGAIVIATTAVLCMLFVPKIVAIREPAGEEKSSNTFATPTTFENRDLTIQSLHRRLHQKLEERDILLDELTKLDRQYFPTGQTL
ncbi:gamma-aminobutyric acid type B receptor subunit 1-like [Diadema antillarum]|uniref:gamma-aminobutyric acid type B receptor subunit 1-like n=1 Tax=Diadema antillarum TaxID=105358 RepID=UPI003A8B240F